MSHCFVGRAVSSVEDTGSHSRALEEASGQLEQVVAANLPLEPGKSTCMISL